MYVLAATPVAAGVRITESEPLGHVRLSAHDRLGDVLVMSWSLRGAFSPGQRLGSRQAGQATEGTRMSERRSRRGASVSRPSCTHAGSSSSQARLDQHTTWTHPGCP
jgi:hypothetical protein